MIHSQGTKVKYTAEAHSTWAYLLARQKKILTNYACPEFMTGLNRIALDENQVPNINDVEKSIQKYTPWHLVEATDIIRPKQYFELLSQRTLPVILKIRPFSQADFYIDDAPDVFHELFGHCPLLTIPGYADFLFEYGNLALSYGKEKISFFTHLFWYTVEVGLIQTDKQRYAYGAAVLSSFTEIKRCFSDDINIKALDITRDLPSEHAGNELQSVYYSINSLSQLFSIPKDIDKLFKQYELSLANTIAA